jgi:hypothetical protein
VYVAVAVSAPVDVEPERGRLPLHAPEPVHAVALVLVHVRVLDPPDATDEGEAVSETVGAGVGGPEKVMSSINGVRQAFVAESVTLRVWPPGPSETEAL